MSAKMAHVIAIELAILIVVLIWLGISRAPSVQLHPVVEAHGRTDDSPVATTPVRKTRSRDLLAANGDAALENSTQAIEEQPPEYVPEIATEPDVSSDYGEDLVAETEPSYTAVDYTAVDDVPVVDSSDYYVAPPVVEIVEFVQPSQIIVFSNPRSCRRPGGRPARPSCPTMTPGPQFAAGGNVPAWSGNLPPRQNTGAGAQPRQNPAGGLAPRRTVGARVVPQNRVAKARWNP